MKEAEVTGKLGIAGANTRDTGICPDCAGQVQKQRRKRMRGGVTYFYRHRRGQGKDCPRRYHPT